MQGSNGRLTVHAVICQMADYTGVAVQNVEWSKTSFYMSKVSGSCHMSAVHVKDYRNVLDRLQRRAVQNVVPRMHMRAELA